MRNATARCTLLILAGYFVAPPLAAGQAARAPAGPETRVAPSRGSRQSAMCSCTTRFMAPENRFCSSMAAAGLSPARGHPTT